MKPTPDELIRGVRDLLRQIGPELVSAEAKAALKRAMYVLRETAWEDEGFALMRENVVLAAMIDRVRAWHGEGAAPTRIETPTSFGDARGTNMYLRCDLARLLDELAAQPLDASAALRGELARSLAALRASDP
ncbi:hypothetical protein [Sphingomonas sp.]|uniref:hypothetical protein n=1 Tax=Sphingomonas sp. TaxID=28214 RepID=UPI001EC522CD|nr:hypothetical protein [Sphingomonas sp.]MBX3595037.1 hypothetical protein [Sphingomonas sp.]